MKKINPHVASHVVSIARRARMASPNVASRHQPTPQGLGVGLDRRPDADKLTMVNQHATTSNHDDDDLTPDADGDTNGAVSVRDLVRANAQRAGRVLHANMLAAKRAEEQASLTIEDQHERVVKYLAAYPAEGPSLRAVTRIDALAAQFPSLGKILDRSPTVRRIMEDERALLSLTETLTNGGTGLAELVANYGGAKNMSDAEAMEELELLQKARDELLYFRTGVPRPGASPMGLPVQPTEAEDEAYLVSVSKGGENDEFPPVRDVYLRAHAKKMDIAVPFTAAFLALILAALGCKFVSFTVCFGAGCLLLAVAHQHARRQVQYHYDNRNVGTMAAMTVHALVFTTAMQFYTVLMPAYFAEAPIFAMVDAVCFVLCPYLFYKTYALGPGYCPTAGSDFHSWKMTMERVSATMGGKNQAENAALMMQKNRYCKTCHAARPMRSKHCPMCNRCVDKMDHHCPITMTCIGANNQRAFLSATSTMLVGQSLFLYFSSKYFGELVDAHSAQSSSFGVLNFFIVRWRAWNDAPYGIGLFFLQIFLTLYCALIVGRMAFGVAANLTVNEMENAWRYEYLQSGDEKYPYRNVFDAGPRINCLTFWRNVDKKRDWDGYHAAAERNQADLPVCPRFSYGWFHSSSVMPNFLRAICKLHSEGPLLPPTAANGGGGDHHGHSHGGKPCEHDHGHGHSPGHVAHAV